MSEILHNIYHRFQTAILDNAAAVAADDIKINGPLSVDKKLAIYIDGYRLRLTGAVKADYPALQDYLGAEVLNHLAYAYVESHPSLNYNLDRYSLGFAPFVATQNVDTFSHDLARLEACITAVFMAPESEAATAADFRLATPEDFGNLRLKPRAASAMQHFAFPVDEWLIRQRHGEKPERPEPCPQFLYIYRNYNEVLRRNLPEAAYRLLQSLFSDLSVSEAFDDATRKYPQHTEVITASIQPWFADWVASGFFAKP